MALADREATLLVVALVALACGPAAGPPPGHSPPQSTSAAPLAEFCKSDACLSYDEQLGKLTTSCAPAEAGSCDAYSTITYPRYPIEVRRFYDASGKLVAARVDLVEHAGGRKLYGELPTCTAKVKPICAAGP